MSLLGELTPPYTLEQLVTVFRDIADDSPGDIVDQSTDWTNDDAGLLWKNSDIVRYANEAQKELFRRIRFYDNQTAAITQIAITKDVQTYAYDPRILGITRAKFVDSNGDQYTITKAMQEYLDENQPNWQISEPLTASVVTLVSDNVGDTTQSATITGLNVLGNIATEAVSLNGTTPVLSVANFLRVLNVTLDVAAAGIITVTEPGAGFPDNIAAGVTDQDAAVRHATGKVQYYVEDEHERSLRLWRTPELDGTLYLNVWRLPLLDLQWATRSLLIETPTEHQDKLLDYMLHRAYLKRDAETDNPQLSGDHLALFEANVGTRVSAHLENVRRKESRAYRRVRAHYF